MKAPGCNPRAASSSHSTELKTGKDLKYIFFARFKALGVQVNLFFKDLGKGCSLALLLFW